MKNVTPAVRVFPDAPDTFACAEVLCPALDTDTVEGCKRKACPFGFQRQREEDEIDRARKDKKQRTRDHA